MKKISKFSIAIVGIKRGVSLTKKECKIRAHKIHLFVEKNSKRLTDKCRFNALKNAAWYTWAANK